MIGKRKKMVVIINHKNTYNDKKRNYQPFGKKWR